VGVAVRIRRIIPFVLALCVSTRAAAQSQDSLYWAQSFMSPAESATLTQILLGGLRSTTPIGFDLREFDGTQYLGPSLFSFVETGGVGANYSLNMNVMLAPNTMYAIAMNVSQGAGTGSAGDFFEGSFYSFDGTPRTWQDSGRDMVGFGVGYDGAEAVYTTPEPESMLLVGSGLAGVFGFARRRRRSA